MSIARAAKLILTLVDDVSKPAAAVVSAMDRVNARVRAIDHEMAAVSRRMFAASAQAIAFAAAVSNPVRAAMKFEDAMADVAKVVEASPAQFSQLRDDLLEMSKVVPMTVEDLATMAAAAGQAGIAVEDLAGFTRLVAESATAWGMTADQAGENLAKIRAALGLTNDQTKLLADAINHVSNNTASSASDLTDYTRRVGAVGRQYGLSAEQTLAFGAAMISSGAQSEVAATSFRNMGKALVRGASATKAQRKAFRQLGMDATEVAADMQRDAVGTINEVFAALRSLPREVQASVMSDLFGDEARALAPLIENAELLRQVLGLVASETVYAGSVQAEFQKRSETTSSALQLLGNRARAAGIAFGESLLPRVRATSAALGGFFDRVASFVQANQAFVADLTTLVGGFLTLRVATLAGSYALLFARREMLLAAGVGLKLGAALKAVTIVPLVAGLARARTALVGFAAAASISGSASAFGIAAAGMGKAALGLLNPMRLAHLAAVGLSRVLMFTGVGLAITAVAAAVEFVRNNLDGLKAMATGVGDGFTAALGPVAPMLEPVTSGISRLFALFANLTGPIDASEAQWRGWGVSIGTSVGGAVRSVVEFGQRTVEIARNVVDTITGIPGQVVGFGTALYSAGAAMVQSLWDGAVAKFNEFVTWLTAIPSRIREAIGRIDLSNIIRWPSLPSWMGGGEASAPAVTGPSTTAGSASAGRTKVDGARAAGGPVERGLTYIVGERGRELFTPGADGFITPNHAIDAADSPGGVGAPAGPTINLSVVNNMKIAGGADVEATARRVAQSVVKQLTNELDRALGRSSQIIFGSGNAYGEA